MSTDWANNNGNGEEGASFAPPYVISYYDDDEAERNMVDPQLLGAMQGRHLAQKREGRERRRADKVTIEWWRAEMSAMYAQGDYLETIARKMTELTGKPFNKQAISYHIARLVNFWREKGLAHIDEKKALVLARLDQIETQAMNAWFRSMSGKSTSTKEEVREEMKAKLDKKRGKKAQAQEDEYLDENDDLLIPFLNKYKANDRRETSAGDGTFLRIMLDVNRERCKIWGLYVQTDEGRPTAQLSDEQRENRMLIMLQNAARRRQLAQASASAQTIDVLPTATVPVSSARDEGAAWE